MDLSIITTYRCNAKCSMCHVWKNPTHPKYEVSMDELKKLPNDFGIINLTGGEPTLRSDLMEICDLLVRKTQTLEISTNGLHAGPLEAVLRKYPCVKIRISIEGIGATNDTIRGEKNGYESKVATMKRLIAAGGKDLGFATTFQDENAADILPLYALCKQLNIEFASSTTHNGFQFYRTENQLYDRTGLARQVEPLITEMLRGWDVKTWFRAYLNLGLMRKMLGQDRTYACTAATDGVYLDPWSDVYACNVRNDLHIGNLRNQSWSEIIQSERMKEVREKVSRCDQNCWMAGVAKGAMRMPYFHQLPKPGVLRWVMVNKFKVLIGRPIQFDRYVNYAAQPSGLPPSKRESFLHRPVKPVVQAPDSTRYSQHGTFFNR